MSSVHESPRSLKRDRDSFEELADLQQPFPVPADFLEQLKAQEERKNLDTSCHSKSTPSISIDTMSRDRAASPARSSTGSLTDAGSVTPTFEEDSSVGGNGGGGKGMSIADFPPFNGTNNTDSLSAFPPISGTNTTNTPSAFAALNGMAPPPKKTKLTFAEKEMRRIQKEIKDQEKAAERAKKDAERQAQAEEKAKKDAEKEADRKRREAEREEKKAALEAEKATKEEKRRKKEEEKQKAEEEKRKKERSQKTLSSFFNVPPLVATARRGSVGSKGRSSMSPAPPNSNPSLSAAAASPAAVTPGKPKLTLYEKTFPEFFIHADVKVATINRFERDGEAMETLQNTIDSYILGNRSPGRKRTFDSATLFHLPHQGVQRGKRCMSVREIMTEFSGNSSRPIDLTTDSQNFQIKKMHDLLKRVPMKFLQFREDVRPPYRGTYTSRPVTGMTRLARNPLRRDLPNTDYDYDSEAEWVEDEDAEDCNSEGEEEDDGDDVEDMDGFLDDENDELAQSKRMVLQGDLEPVSTGLCWENSRKRNTNVKLAPYRMEVILDPTIKSIDPFSTAYWNPQPAPTSMDPPRVPLTTMKITNFGINISSASAKPVKPFFTTGSDLLKVPSSTSVPSYSATAPKDGNGKPKRLLPAEDIAKFKEAVQGSNLSKVGLIEVLKKQFPGRPAAAIKGTLEVVAKRVGLKEADKRWVLVEE